MISYEVSFHVTSTFAVFNPNIVPLKYKLHTNHFGMSFPSFTMFGTSAASQGPKAIAKA
jgi:hypothetical protein